MAPLEIRASKTRSALGPGHADGIATLARMSRFARVDSQDSHVGPGHCVQFLKTVHLLAGALGLGMTIQ